MLSKRESCAIQNGFHESEGITNSKKPTLNKDRLSADQQLAFPDPEPPRPEGGWKIPVSRPFISDKAEENVLAIIREGLISSATEPVRKFERELESFYSALWAKACSSGYAALVLALKNARVGPAHEVVIPSLTMVAVVSAVVEVGAKPVFVDCAKHKDGTLSLNPSVDQYRAEINERTKAIIVTHTYGVPADSPALKELCEKHNIFLIEDIAEAIGTMCNGEYVGTFGHYAAASLYANKSITSGDGGFVLCNASLREGKSLANAHANHGFTPGHHFVHWEFSGNYKMCGLAAALVTPSVEMIPQVMEDRLRIATKYREHLSEVADLTLMPINPHGPDCPWVFGVTVKSKNVRTFVRKQMAVNGIETRDYFFPLHLQPCVVDKFGPQLPLPNAEKLGRTGFYLPTFHALKNEDIAYISSCLKQALAMYDDSQTQ